MGGNLSPHLGKFNPWAKLFVITSTPFMPSIALHNWDLNFFGNINRSLFKVCHYLGIAILFNSFQVMAGCHKDHVAISTTEKIFVVGSIQTTMWPGGTTLLTWFGAMSLAALQRRRSSIHKVTRMVTTSSRLTFNMDKANMRPFWSAQILHHLQDIIRIQAHPILRAAW